MKGEEDRPVNPSWEGGPSLWRWGNPPAGSWVWGRGAASEPRRTPPNPTYLQLARRERFPELGEEPYLEGVGGI